MFTPGYFVRSSDNLVDTWVPDQNIYDLYVAFGYTPPNWFYVEQGFVGGPAAVHYDNGVIYGNPLITPQIVDTLTTGLIGTAVDPNVANLLTSLVAFNTLPGVRPNKYKGIRRALDDLGVPYSTDTAM
jgi:hypothetical protein